MAASMNSASATSASISSHKGLLMPCSQLHCGVRKISNKIRRLLMILRRTCVWVAALLCATALISTGPVQAAQISGTITTTMAITEDSQLVGDVTCAVTGVPCLDITASNVTLDLNGFSITGQADPQTGCAGSGASGTEHGIRILQQTGVTVRG